MDFYEWRECNEHKAEKFRERIAAGEKGNPDNPMMAAEIAYDAGIREGAKRLAVKFVDKICDYTETI